MFSSVANSSKANIQFSVEDSEANVAAELIQNLFNNFENNLETIEQVADEALYSNENIKSAEALLDRISNLAGAFKRSTTNVDFLLERLGPMQMRAEAAFCKLEESASLVKRK